MTQPRHTGDLAGAYALEACPPDEERSVAEHLSHCPTCAAEATDLGRVAGWIGASSAQAPAADLRARVLSAALAARPAGRPRPDAEAGRLTGIYAAQVAELDRLLGRLSPAEWLLPSGPHRSVRDLVVHLRGSDAPVAAATGIARLESTSDAHLGWQRQAGAIVSALGDADSAVLAERVPLAGRTAVQRPLREALVQRGFETWIHAEDVRAVLAAPPRPPSAAQLADIVAFAVRLLPAAMVAAGREHPGSAVRLVLTGDGGGTQLVRLSPAPGSAVAAEVSMPAERFCRLLAGRLTSPLHSADVGGDRDVATDFLTVAATMGCD
ncbi:TIGR03083 family protein [Asanoa hainanensis]|uniref:TIGR03083 family protein n=1 Tax=Asanoa hainanensis TaxID=560556 RepID=A0A239P837_9ACTN|nr:maleylpyruvate isomerase family mycothiol-dependent enzyme [Asanoa hainanensis]SNT63230.1 TIGR03083 family protein [Asanoa hainanensis]